MGSFESCSNLIYDKFVRRDQFLLFNIENSYRVQITVELVMESIPQIIIQATNNNTNKSWGGLETFSFTLSAIILLKNLSILTVFFIRKFIEHRDSVSFRPQTYSSIQNAPKLDKFSMISMKAYLLDSRGENIDMEGNT